MLCQQWRRRLDRAAGEPVLTDIQRARWGSRALTDPLGSFRCGRPVLDVERERLRGAVAVSLRPSSRSIAADLDGLA
jgi:hypothetical protein